MMFGYGEIPPWWQQDDNGWLGEIGPDLLVLRGPELAQDGPVIRARFEMAAGERTDYVLQHGSWSAGKPGAIDAAAAQDATERWWRDWIARFDKPTDWPDAIKRSLLTLRAMTYLPTGGIIAAPTLGLPEKPGGKMNWDYRYCWLRNSTFTLTALLNAGFHAEAEAWEQWLYRAIGGLPDKMRIMYRVDGGRQIEEREIGHLQGWNGAKPVRVGNAAATQRQLDVYGEVLDSAHLCRRAGMDGQIRAGRPPRLLSGTSSGSGRSLIKACGSLAATHSTTCIPRSCPGSPPIASLACLDESPGATKSSGCAMPSMPTCAITASTRAAAASCNPTAPTTWMRAC